MSVDPCEMPRVLRVSEGVTVRQAVDNMGWVDLGDAGLAVDALEQPELEDEVFAAIADTLGDKPVRYLLNTHTHYDHIALNKAFRRRYGTQVINYQTEPVADEGLTFHGDGRSVEILHLPDCHTVEDCIVRVEPDSVLFVGDIFGWGLIPLTTPLTNASARHLLASYYRLAGYEAGTVVPGHGPVCTTRELRRWVQYFRWLIEGVSEGVRAGRSDDEITGKMPPPRDMQEWWRFVAWKHLDSIEKVLAAVRSGTLSPEALA